MKFTKRDEVVVMAQIALLNCERAGMEAENTYRCGNNIAYGAVEFQALYDRYVSVIGIDALSAQATAPARTTMTFEAFVRSLQESGWKATLDAQHEGIRMLWEKMFPVMAQMEEDATDLRGQLTED